MRLNGSCEDLCDANGWRNTTLGALVSETNCFIQTGPFGSQLHKHDYQENGIGVVNPTHLIGNKIVHDDVPRISTETASRLAKHRVSQGDILFARRGEIGRHGLVTEAEYGWLCGTGCFLVRILRKDVDNQFLSYFFSTRDTVEWLNRHAAGVVMPNLNNTVLHSLPIRMPALPEQQKIAAVLGLVQRAIEQQERLIVLTAELKKALLHKLFTEGLRGEPQKQTEIGPVPESWEIRKLGDVFECLDGRRIPVRQSDRVPGPYPYYGASGVVDHVSEFIFDGTYLLVAEDGENLESRKLPIAFIAEGKFWVNNHAHVLKTRTGSMKFFEQFISHINIKDYLSGTTRPKLNKALMTSIRLPFPKEDEQAEIADVLEMTERKRSSHVRRVVALRGLFRTLLHHLMTAQIRVDNLDLPELSALKNY
jgi:type I restriction enzyme S subunit